MQRADVDEINRLFRRLEECNAPGIANIRGFLTRLPGSCVYRRPPNGLDDVPLPSETRTALGTLRVLHRRYCERDD